MTSYVDSASTVTRLSKPTLPATRTKSLPPTSSSISPRTTGPQQTECFFFLCRETKEAWETEPNAYDYEKAIGNTKRGRFGGSEDSASNVHGLPDELVENKAPRGIMPSRFKRL